MDEDMVIDEDDFVGYSSIPFECLVSGLVVVKLYDSEGSSHGDFDFASIFVRIEIFEY